jgi:4-amino-4-deoxy-L-arabinose transferase-like glycosyltransferase
MQIYTRTLFLVVLPLSLLAIFLRTHNLGQQPYWMDEGYTVNAIMSIADKGQTILDSGEYYYCPLYCYPTSYIVTFLEPDPFSYRLLATFLSILFIPIFFFSIKDIFGTRPALISTFFLSFSYYQIAWARQARWYTMLELFFFLSLYFFYKFLYTEKSRQKMIYFLLTIAFTTLACLTHALAYLLIILFALILIFQIFKKTNLLHNKKYFLLSTLFFFLIFTTFFVKEALEYQIRFSYVLPYYLSFYLYNYILFIPFTIYILYTNNKLIRNKIQLFAFVLITYFLALSFLSNIVHYRYLFHITPILFLLGTLGMLEVYDNLKNETQKTFFILFVFIFFFVSKEGLFWPANFYNLESEDNNLATLFTPERPYLAYTPQPDWNSAYEYIKLKKLDNQEIISSMPQFNRIFLDTPGYWIKYSYTGVSENMDRDNDNKEFYVGAQILHNLEDLQALTGTTSGYIVLDQMAKEKISPDIIKYIEQNTTQVFAKETNTYSKLWVYKFDKI